MTRSRTPSEPTSPDLLIGGTVLILVFLVQLPFARHLPVLLDEGVILQMAVDIGDGKVPYRDGVHYAFPGVFYLTALVFEIFGPSVGAARLLAASLFSVAAAATAMMARWWCSRSELWAVITVILIYRIWASPHWHMLNYSPMAVAMNLSAALLVGEQLARTGYRWAAFGGLVCGVAILAKQDSGGATAVALGIALLLLGGGHFADRFRRALAFSLCVTAVVVACFIAVWWAGYLEDLIREGIYGPLYGVANYDYLLLPDLFPLFEQDPHLRENTFSYFPQILLDAHGPAIFSSWLYTQTPFVDAAVKLFYHSPWIIALVTAVITAFAWRAPRSLAMERRVLALLLAGAFLLAFNPPRDWVHILVLYPPTLLLLFSGLPATRGHTFVRAALGTATAVLAIASVYLAAEFRSRNAEAVVTERGTFYTTPVLAEGFRDVLDAISRTPKSTPVAAFPYHPFVNFMANRRPLSRYLFLWPVEWNDKRDSEIIAELEAHPEAMVLYSPSQLLHLGKPREFAPELFEYLADSFEIADRYGPDTPGLKFLELRRKRESHEGSLAEAIQTRGKVTKRRRLQTALEELPRDEYLDFVAWPFRRTMTLRSQPAAEVALRLPIVPQPGDCLLTGFATYPELWDYALFPPVDFRLAVVAGGEETTLIERAVRSGIEPADRRWFDVSVDMTPWAGQSIELVFAIFTRWGTKPSNELGGWAPLRIVSASQDGSCPGQSAGAPATRDETIRGSAQPAAPRGNPGANGVAQNDSSRH